MSAAVVASSSSSSSSDHNSSEDCNKDEHKEVSEDKSGSNHSIEPLPNTEALNSPATLATLIPSQYSNFKNEGQPSTVVPIYKQLSQQNQFIGNRTANNPCSFETIGNKLGGDGVGYTGNANNTVQAHHSKTVEENRSCELANQQRQLAPPLPKNLCRILTEVATSGTSSLLPWREDGNQLNGNSSNSNKNYSCGHNTPQQANVFHKHGHGTSSHHQRSGNIRESYKRARTSSSHSRSSMGSKHQLLHRHFYSSGGSVSATATATMATETGNSAAAFNGSTRSHVVTAAGQIKATKGSSSAHQSLKNCLHNCHLVNHRLTDTGSGGGRKRPLFLLRTTNSGATSSANIFSPGSVGSGRTSGSEHEDTSQYECDSEGTSATSNSEISFEQGRNSARGGGGSASGNNQTSERNQSTRKRRGLALQEGVAGGFPFTNTAMELPGQLQYKCLKEAFRTALNLVLDYFYKNRGYKLSPAELKSNVFFSKEHITATTAMDSKRRADEPYNDTKRSSSDAVADDGEYRAKLITSRETMMREGIFSMNGPRQADGQLEIRNDNRSHQKEDVFFQRRKQRLLGMLGKAESESKPTPSSQALSVPGSIETGCNDNEPPFTIQRVAEVLIAAERYYAQTHKLCNCLEKLLLVTSSTSAFGGSAGGQTSQSRQEETEHAALLDEKGRLRSEFILSHRRPLQKTWSPLSDDAEAASCLTEGTQSEKDLSLERHLHITAEIGDRERADEVEEGAQNHQGVGPLDEELSREMLEAAARASLRTKFDHVGIDPHSSAVNSRDARSVAENRGMTNSPPPPSLGMTCNSAIVLPGGHSGLLRQHNHGSPTSPDRDQLYSLVRTPSPILFNNSGCESSPPSMAPLHANIQLMQMHHPVAMTGVSPYQLMAFSASVSGSVPGPVPGSATKDMDVESRSSASSDVDSESDVSFDDSASDRSDGSDSGQHYEPLTAARAMALNRMQQQQRLQSRVLTSLQQHGGGGEAYRPPADSEYQSGDSMDSTRAEDSGGSDSSSSDHAD